MTFVRGVCCKWAWVAMAAACAALLACKGKPGASGPAVVPYFVPPTLAADVKAAHDAVDAYWASKEAAQKPSGYIWNSPVGLTLRGYAALGDAEKAVSIEDKFFSMKGDARVYVLAAKMQFRLKNRERAKDYMDKALAMKASANLLGELANVLVQTDETELFNSLVASQDVAIEYVVPTLAGRGNFDRAAELLTTDRGFSKLRGYALLAKAESEAGRTAAAVEHYKASLAVLGDVPDATRTYLPVLAASLALVGDVEGSVAATTSYTKTDAAHDLADVVRILIAKHQLDLAATMAGRVPDFNGTPISWERPRLTAYVLVAEAAIAEKKNALAQTALKDAVKYLDSLKLLVPEFAATLAPNKSYEYADVIDAYGQLSEAQSQAGDANGAKRTRDRIPEFLLDYEAAVRQLPDNSHVTFNAFIVLTRLQRWFGDRDRVSAALDGAAGVIPNLNQAERRACQTTLDQERGGSPSRGLYKGSYISRVSPSYDFITFTECLPGGDIPKPSGSRRAGTANIPDPDWQPVEALIQKAAG